MRNITVLSGGSAGARFLRGLQQSLEEGSVPGLDPAAEVTVVVNTADDLWVHGLKACPDLDASMHALTATGRTAPVPGAATRTVRDELAAYGVEPSWFHLEDDEVATHLVRTQMLEAGYSLSRVTEALCRRWRPRGRLLPMTDDRVETHVAVADPEAPSGRRVVHVQEYRHRLRAEPPAEAVVVVGLERATPAPGVVEAVTAADLVLLAPADPVCAIGTIVGVPGVRDALVSGPAPVVGLSPVAVADPVEARLGQRLLAGVGVAWDAEAVGAHYGSRGDGGLLDHWLPGGDRADAPSLLAAALRAVG